MPDQRVDESGVAQFEIDAVIPWVDGEDPKHSEKRVKFAPKVFGDAPKAAKNTRYADSGEIEFCVTSILKFAPWVRYVFIVTDQQVPEWYASLSAQLKDRIRIIDHNEVFRGHKELLPTFNSLSIETMIWRIPDLAERFIYFNDDLALLSPVKKQDFFTRDGVLIRGKWSSRKIGYFFIKKLKRFIRKGRVTHHFSQLQGAVMAAPSARKFFLTGHIPQPMRKTTLEGFFTNNPGLLINNAKYKFRSWSQFWPVSLAHHLEIVGGTAVCLDDSESLYLSPSKVTEDELSLLINDSGMSRLKFLCVQSLDQASPSFNYQWRNWMKHHVGSIQDFQS